MSKSRQQSNRRNAERSKSRAHIAVRFKENIKGKVVDISGASPYFKKLWAVYRPLVSQQATLAGADLYELEESFFQSFVSCLQDLHLQRQWGRVDPPNVIAKALSWAAHQTEPDENDVDEALSFVPFPDPAERRLAEDDPLSFLDSLSPQEPISNDWRELDKNPVPFLEPVTLRWDYDARHKNGQKKKKWVRGYRDDCPVVNLIPEYNDDRTKRPTLSVKIEGAPVCLLMKAYGRNKGQATNKQDSDAETLWNALQHWLAVALGFKKSTGGAPPLGKGRRAAWSHDHLGDSWTKVARRLDHTERPSKEAAENYRKQAKQFWRRLRKHVDRRLS